MTSEALERLLPKYYDHALQQEKLNAATNPLNFKLDFSEKMPLQMIVELEVKPRLNEPDYTQMHLEKQKIPPVTEEEINTMIFNLRRARSTLISKESKAVVENGDMVTIDYKGNIDGQSFENSELKGGQFEVGGEFFSEFSALVLGMQLGETKKQCSIVLTDTFSTDLVGKTAQFDVTLTSLHNIQIAKIDGEFLKSYNQENEEDFRKMIYEIKEKNHQDDVYSGYRKEIQTQLVKIMGEFELPEHPVQEMKDFIQKEAKEKNFESLAEKQKFIDFRVTKFYEEIRLNYILESIQESKGVQLNQEKVVERFYPLAKMMDMDAKEFYQTNEGKNLFSTIVKDILKEDVLNIIVRIVLGEKESIERIATSSNAVPLLGSSV